MNSRMLAYQGVLSPSAASGRRRTYQPRMTSFRKPARSRASRSVRESFAPGMAWSPPSCNPFRASRADASLSCTLGTRVRCSRLQEFTVYGHKSIPLSNARLFGLILRKQTLMIPRVAAGRGREPGPRQVRDRGAHRARGGGGATRGRGESPARGGGGGGG